MFFRTPYIEDAELPAHLDVIIEAIRAHFAREKAEMEKIGAPIHHCNKVQHKALLTEAWNLRDSFSRAEARMRRHMIGLVLAHLVANHIAIVDQTSATFFDRKHVSCAEGLQLLFLRVFFKRTGNFFA